MPSIEIFIDNIVQWLRLIIETIGVGIIALGVIVTVVGFVRALREHELHGFNPIRLRFARYLVLGLEFQLAADILSTAIAPNWDDIGRLAAIAVIRTGLNFFLMKEMKHERATIENERTRQNEEDTRM